MERTGRSIIIVCALFLLLVLTVQGAYGASIGAPLPGGEATGEAAYLNGQVKLVPSLSAVNQIAVGSNFSIALKGDGTVWGFGADSAGQLGDGAVSAIDPSASNSATLLLPVGDPDFKFPQGAAISCDKGEILAGGSLTCSVPAVNITSGTPVYKWYVDDIEVPGVSVNTGALLTMPDEGTGSRVIKVTAGSREDPQLKAFLTRTITVNDFGFNITAKGYDQGYQVLTAPDGSKIYPVKR